MKLFHRIGLCLAAAAAMFLSLGLPAHAQQQTLKGVVIDQNGEPIIGGAVFVVETNKGEITDIDGNFSIKVENGQTLRISYIGFATQEIPYRGQENLRVVLQEETTALDEVVVVGYGSMTRKEMTSHDIISFLFYVCNTISRHHRAYGTSTGNEEP